MAIIKTLLDTDLYKFTMQQTVLHQFPHANDVEYHFRCRTPNVNLAQYLDEINGEIDHLCTLTFSEEELKYLGSLRFIKPDYIAFLTLFRMQRKYINVVDLGDGQIDVVIKGPWLHTIPFEIYILSIVNEVYFRHLSEGDSKELIFERGMNSLQAKIDMLAESKDIKFSDFGTRRRFSREWQEVVVAKLKNDVPNNFTGTSNVYLAMKYGLTPIGTMAHEYLQACQALGPRLRDSQKFALEVWVQEYRGDLGIALTDVIGLDAFLNDFDLYFCKLFDGVRHDSGDPVQWGEKVLAHYKKMRIDATTKNFVFSDGLDFAKMIQLQKHFDKRVNCFFGIGTNLTNDVGYKALNIVLKMTNCNGGPVAKLSDTPGKSMCNDQGYMDYLSSVFGK